MIEEVAQLGKVQLKEVDFLSSIIKTKKSDSKKKQYILKFNFKSSQPIQLTIDANEEMSEKSAEKYIFVGSADGANSPQWYATTENIAFILSETINELCQIKLPLDILEKLKFIRDNYFVELPLPRKYKYTLNFALIDSNLPSNVSLYEETKHMQKAQKEYLGKVVETFKDYLKKTYGLSLDEIGLITIFIDDVPLCSLDEYKIAVVESKKTKSKKTTSNAICSLCQKTGEDVTSDVSSKTKIKLYTTNLSIFASGVNKKYYRRNMQLCQGCLNSVLAGENYLNSKLKTKLAAFDVYLLPHFVLNEPLNKQDLDFVCQKTINSFSTISNLNQIKLMREEILDILSLNSQYYFLLNFVFFRTSQASTKILRYISDIDPSIFERIYFASEQIYEMSKKHISEAYKLKIDLRSIYYMVPVKIERGNPTSFRNVLALYDAILSQRNISRGKLIADMIKVINILRFDLPFYNVSSSEEAIHFTILKMCFFLKFLEYMKCIKEGETMDVESLNLNDEVKAFIKEMGYNKQMTAMFLLGTLIGSIGNKQYSNRQGDDKKEDKPKDNMKPILNKINFNGIDKAKIIRLSVDVFNKLRQEKILKNNEVIYAEYKKLIDEEIEKWKLNKQEALFYLLSGYSYQTAKTILNANKNNENEEDDINE